MNNAKKILMGGVVLMLTLTANAENRKWDFRNWSAATVENLKAGDDWSDIEKATASEPTEISKDKCFWEVTASGTSEGVELTANGTPIAELQGLLYTNTTSRSLAIAVDYIDNSSINGAGFGPYSGASYLWLGSSKKNYFIIPNVKAGATIKMGVESHKLTDARGINLYVGHGTSGTQLKSPSGETVSAPKEYTDQEWLVPTDLADTPNDDGTYDIQIYNTNGCHIYYIEVNEDAPAVENAKIAWVYNSQYEGYDVEGDVVYSLLNVNDDFKNVTIDNLDVAGDLSQVDRDSLIKYDVVVVSSTVPEGDAYAQVLKEAIAYVPMLNLNAKLYRTWGYGDVRNTGTPNVTVPESVRTHSLFKASDPNEEYINADGTISLFAEGDIEGVEIPEGSYFADDVVLAADGSTTAIHIHNQERNAYLFIPYPYDNTAYPDNNLVYDLVINAITLLNYSKADVPQALAPTFSEEYNQLNTDVTISSGTKNAVIYYTTDGSTPTNASTLYTGPVNVTEENTVISAIAYADGYSASETSQLKVSIYTTSEMPEIAVEQKDGKAVVSLSTKEEGATVYFNITGSKNPTESEPYTEPFEVSSYTTITAFTGEVEGKKQSEAVTKDIFVEGREVRIDVVSHFDANKTDWSGGEDKTKYYTEGKKNGYAYYDIVGEETVTGSDGQDSIVYVKEPRNVATIWNPGKGWEAKTYGQGMLWENISISADIDNNNTTARYRAEGALDAGGSANSVSFGNVQKSDGVVNDPYSCSIQSTEAFQGPFDVVAIVGNASTSNLPHADICVATDTTSTDNWQTVDTVAFSKTQRFIKRNVISYNGTDKVFVKLQAKFSSVMVFDIYIMNNGEKSQEVSGIREVAAGKEAAGEIIRTEVYSLNGVRTGSLGKGINIVKDVYANGVVKTRKVMVK